MRSRPDVGIFLEDARPLIALVKRLLIEDYEILDSEQARPKRDRVTVYLCNHGPAFAPLPAPVLSVDHLLELGGYNDFVAVTLFHWFVEVVPGASHLLHRYFGHSTRQLRSISGLIEMMKARRFQIIGTAPEGISCALSYDEPVGAFTRVGLMVAALEADADIVLTAQKGVEVFGQRVDLPPGWRLPLRHGPRGLVLPRWYPGCKARVRLRHRRYTPLMSYAGRQALSGRERREQLNAEMAHIRRELIRLYRDIPGR